MTTCARCGIELEKMNLLEISNPDKPVNEWIELDICQDCAEYIVLTIKNPEL